MNIPFDPTEELVYLWAEVLGPTGKARLLLALDTGATSTLVSKTRLIELGYDPEASKEQSRIITGSQSETVSHLKLTRFSALGQQRKRFDVCCYNLPVATGVDGVLGLDFFRGQNLNIDFRNGLITLT